MNSRDFEGYRNNVPRIKWPNDAQLAVSIVVNIEEGAELSIGNGDELNEHIYEVVDQVIGVRDLCMESHFEYGPRAGWPRIRDALRARGILATINSCGRALQATPWIAKEAISDGHEVAAHGWRWESHANMTEQEERKVITRTASIIKQITGKSPVGWHTRSATSVSTRRLLIEHGGFLYDSNAYNDDLPYLVKTTEGAHVVLPYAFDTNDMRFFNNGGFVFGNDFANYCIDAFNRLYKEGLFAPRMLSIGLHTRIIGKPARIDGLEKLLDYILQHKGIWLSTRAGIAKHWRAALGLPVWQPKPCPDNFILENSLDFENES